jgi:hypothetical protein
MTNETGIGSDPHTRHPGRRRLIMASENEEFWLEAIRQASSDADPPPNLERVRRVREIFRGK